jgi:hypothetical protein
MIYSNKILAAVLEKKSISLHKSSGEGAGRREKDGWGRERERE